MTASNEAAIASKGELLDVKQIKIQEMIKRKEMRTIAFLTAGLIINVQRTMEKKVNSTTVNTLKRIEIRALVGANCRSKSLKKAYKQ